MDCKIISWKYNRCIKRNIKVVLETTMIVRGLIIAVALLVGSASVYWLGSDNNIEESAEIVIKEQTGFDLDITPFSIEKKDDKNGNK